MKPQHFIAYLLFTACALYGGSNVDQPNRTEVAAPSGMWLAKAYRIEVRLHARSVPGNYIDDGLDAVTQATPAFPTDLLNARVDGEATVSFVVSEDGTIRDLKKSKATVDAFAESALQSAKAWRFKPIFYHGRPTSLQVDAVYTFSVYYD